MRNGTTLLGSTVTSAGVIGGGGYMTGLQVADDGTIIGRCDTRPGYTLAPGATAWVPIMQPAVDVLVSDLDFTGLGPNCFANGISPSNSAVMMVCVFGFVWVKKAGATYFTKTSLPRRTSTDGNSSQRGTGDPLVCDPANPLHWIFIAPEGAFRTIDAGDTWTAISGVPAPSGTLLGSVAFDRSSAVTGGNTQRIYMMIPGSGVYRSTNGGPAFSAMTAPPVLTSTNIAVGRTTGTVIISGHSTTLEAQIYRWNGTAWSTPTCPNLKNICFSVANANRVYGVDIAGNYAVSLDDGATWTGNMSTKINVSVDVAWHKGDTGYKTTGGMIERPTDGLPYVSSGVGCWKLPSPPTTNSSVNWVGISKGIENMVGTGVVYAPDGVCAITMQDKQCMLFKRSEVGRIFPSEYGPYGGINLGQCADYAPEDTNFWVVTTFDALHNSPQDIAYTTDRGKTWTSCPSLRTISGSIWCGGNVAVLSKDVWVVGQMANSGSFGAANRAKNTLYITRDRGGTWSEVLIGNGNAVCTFLRGFCGSARRVLVKDPYYTAAGLLGRVYFYNCADVENPASADTVACQGMWWIDVPVANTAPTVTRKTTTRLVSGNQDAIHNTLTVLGRAGNLGWRGGDGCPFTYRSTDGGVTWAEFTGTDDQAQGSKFMTVFGIAAGRARFDSTYPTLYVVGFRYNTNSGTAYTAADLAHYGLWASYDDGSTWKRLAAFPGGAADHASDLGASMTNFGEITLTFGGQAAETLYYDYRLRAA